MRTVMSVCAIAALAFGLPAASAWAHDLVPPPWRDQDGTTFQEWSFDTSANPATPEVIRNSYGTASAAIVVGEHGTGWDEATNGFYGSEGGVWDLGAAGTITLDIDNRPVQLEYKEIWLQVTYYLDIFQKPSIDVPGATLLGERQTLFVENAVPFGALWMEQSKWRIAPNPDHEQIVITADLMGSIVDQIVVDTICAPEPATLLLLALASAAFARRRRR